MPNRENIKKVMHLIIKMSGAFFYLLSVLKQTAL